MAVNSIRFQVLVASYMLRLVLLVVVAFHVFFFFFFFFFAIPVVLNNEYSLYNV
jgi:hypothetical protein